MKSKKQMKYITDFGGLDLELFFCSDVLKLNSLHYGMWEPEEQINMHNLKQAQERYSDTLIDSIPTTAVTVLDVGCGMGDLTRKLAKKGFNITAISPDKNHPKFFDDDPEHITFVSTRFENFRSSKKYDVIIMSESQGYFHAEDAFRQCKNLLSPNGMVLISGMFRKTSDTFMKDIPHIEHEYLHTARKHGLTLSKREDITEQTLPTLELTYNSLKEYVVPLKHMGWHFLHSTSRFKALLFRLLFRRQIRKLDKIYNYYMTRSNPVHFKEKARYLRLFFEFEANRAGQ